MHRLMSIALVMSFTSAAFAHETEPCTAMKTSVQTPLPWQPGIDLAVDTIMVYGVGDDFAGRAASWRDKGYCTAMMTGISWGNYAEYYGAGDAFKRDEVQTKRDGELYMHSPGVGCNVPTPGYLDYLKAYIEPAITDGVHGIFLEEPEFWSLAGWSAAFKQAWEQRYGSAWEPPDASVAAQYKASLLKYEMYHDAVRDLTDHIKRRAAEKGLTIGCYVPTHSLINYAHWRIVSPESRLLEIPGVDGLIGQVWTGTAGTGVYYQGELKSRYFEYAFLEYGQLVSMTRPHDAKLWFLADPVEDNSSLTWEHYQRAYEQVLVASLLWPQVDHFEVMPWPGRVFAGKHLTEGGGDAMVAIPPDYASELLAVANALGEMPGAPVALDAGTGRIGMAVSDTMMFQRSEPHHSDFGMGGVFGLALPLLKAGIPVEPVQLEHTDKPGFLDAYAVLLLSYEHQKPLKAAYHEALAAWVRAGGALLFAEGDADAYHAVPAWWNEDGAAATTAYDDLFARLGIDGSAEGVLPAGDGFVRVLRQNPKDLQHTAEGAALVRSAVSDLAGARGLTWRTQGHLAITRGPYVAMAVMDETVDANPVCTLSGQFVDLFAPGLPVLRDPVFGPGSYRLLRRVPDGAATPAVLAAACRVRSQTVTENGFAVTVRGPAETAGLLRVQMPERPKEVTCDPPTDVVHEWDDASNTVLLRFPNTAQDVTITVR